MLVKDLINKLKRVNENNEVVIVDNYDNVFFENRSFDCQKRTR